MNNLLEYPHGSSAEMWFQYISVCPEEVSRIFTKYKGKNTKNYFERKK
jgi:hypothetical protein